MKQEPYKVSLLVPIYGVEKYIERCAISLFKQTYQNVEFVFVNDCTTDNSVSILENVISRFPNRKEVHLYNHQINSGIASTRNTLLSYCTGDFFMFVDSDDWLEENVLEVMVEEQISGDYDLVTCDYSIYEKNGVRHFVEPTINTPRDMLQSLLTGKTSGRLWGRIIRTSLVKNNKIVFIDGANFAEDVMFMTIVCYYCKNHKQIRESLYNYERRNVISYTNSFDAQNSIQSFMNYDKTRLFVDKYVPDLSKEVRVLEISKILGHMCLCSKDVKNKSYYYDVLLKRLNGIDKSYAEQLPMEERIVLYLRKFALVSFYVKIGGFIKRLIR